MVPLATVVVVETSFSTFAKLHNGLIRDYLFLTRYVICISGFKARSARLRLKTIKNFGLCWRSVPLLRSLTNSKWDERILRDESSSQLKLTESFCQIPNFLIGQGLNLAEWTGSCKIAFILYPNFFKYERQSRVIKIISQDDRNLPRFQGQWRHHSNISIISIKAVLRCRKAVFSACLPPSRLSRRSPPIRR